MSNINLRINETEDIKNLIQQLNSKFRELQLTLQQIQGLDGTTPEIFNDIDMNDKTLQNLNPHTVPRILNGETQVQPPVKADA